MNEPMHVRGPESFKGEANPAPARTTWRAGIDYYKVQYGFQLSKNIFFHDSRVMQFKSDIPRSETKCAERFGTSIFIAMISCLVAGNIAQPIAKSEVITALTDSSKPIRLKANARIASMAHLPPK
jgi:hypothetical protein